MVKTTVHVASKQVVAQTVLNGGPDIAKTSSSVASHKVVTHAGCIRKVDKRS